MMDNPLRGIKVLDFSRVLAGPYATQALAEMGADVVKVEWGDGDPARNVAPFISGRSLYYSSINNGKRAIELDPHDPTQGRLVRELLAVADIVVLNLRRRPAEKLGLTVEGIHALNPQAIIVTITGYGTPDGADHPAFDVSIQAEAGLMSLTGTPNGPPVRAGVPVADLVAGLWVVIAATSGLVRRAETGLGSSAEVPLMDSTMSLLSYIATSALHNDAEPARVGSGHQSACPYGAFPTSDGWIVIAVLSDKFWPLLCDALDLAALREDATLTKTQPRLDQRARVEDELTRTTRQMTTNEALTRLRGAGVPSAPVNTVLSALRSPYARERDLVVDYTVDEGRYSAVRGPLQSAPLTPAPARGEDTDEVLDEWLGEQWRTAAAAEE